jgi:hypothetical protein
MGYAVPGILMCASVAGIVSTGITINSYLTTNKAKDTGFKVSMAFLVISIFLFFGSAFWIYKTLTGSGSEGGTETTTEGESQNAAIKAAEGFLASVNESSIKSANNVGKLKTELELASNKIKSQINSELSKKLGELQAIGQKIETIATAEAIEKISAARA